MAEDDATAPAISAFGVVRRVKITGSPSARSIATMYSSIPVCSVSWRKVTGCAGSAPMAAASRPFSQARSPVLSKRDVAWPMTALPSRTQANVTRLAVEHEAIDP